MHDVPTKARGSRPVHAPAATTHSRLARAAAAALALLATAALPRPAVPTGHGPLDADIVYDGGLLSVHVVDAPLGAVLEAVAEASAIDLSVRAPLEEWITATFTGLALDEGLRRLLGGRSTVMIYGEGAERDRLVEVRVYGAAGPPDPETGTLERLHEALGSPDRAARLRAMDAVERYESPAAVDIAADALMNDADPVVRARAAGALASIGGEDAVRALEGGLGDRDAAVRAKVLRGLGMLGGERATLAIAQALFAGGEPELRAVAVEALAAQGTEQARQFLEAVLDDDDDLVRERARLALQR